MYLFIDTISPQAIYILFDSKRNIFAKKVLELRGRESEYFFDSLEVFLSENNLETSKLDGIIVVNGPGSFTAMRIITLTVNTLAFVHHTPLYSIDYFSLGELSGWVFPIIIRANRGEYLIQKHKDANPEIIAITDIVPGNYFGIGDINDFTLNTISIQSSLQYEKICQNILLDVSTKRIEPLYIKKPNIT